MALGDGTVWAESLPDNSTLAHQIDDYDRDLRVGVRSRMAREHVWSSSQTATSEAGHHQFITFQQQTGAPSLSTALTQVGALYVGSSAASYPLVFENSAGSTVTLLGIETIYPVGSLYISTLSTNPNTLLGFGTWSAFAAGRVLLGVGTSDAVYAAGATGGESTHVLTTTEMPAHTHNTKVYSGGTANEPKINAADAGATDNNTFAGALSAGSDGAHNNLQPYVVVYIWKRTA